jgi:sterol desaturase/sphingolipid hydroxylase (fatty acid hydroxylase superfamily)
MGIGWEPGVSGAIQVWHHLDASYHHLNPAVRAGLQPVVFLIRFLPAIYFLEWLSGGRTDQYKSVGFRQDLVYLFVHMTGFFRTLTTVYLLGSITPYLRVFDLHLIDYIPQHLAMFRALAYLLVADCMMYWYHRWQHTNRLLWAFHTTHHSQRGMSFLTQTRFHPVEDALRQLVMYVPLLIVGAGVQDWAHIVVLYRIIEYLQHSQVAWSFGPFGKVFVTARYHAFHHSADPEHYNHNFSVVLNVWDRMFGTFLYKNERPARFGLPDLEMPTVASTLLVPFRLVYETYFKPRKLAQAAGED